MSWDRFADDARQIVLCAHELAVALGHDEVGVGHLFVGVLVQEGAAARVLRSVGLTEAGVRTAVGAAAATGKRVSAGELSLTWAASGALGDAVREALARGENEASSVHLVLGLVRDPDGAGTRFLSGLGVGRERVLDQALGLLKDPTPRRSESTRERQERPGTLREPLPAPASCLPFERLTAPARLVLTVAEEMARELGHPEVGPEHLLLGLLRVDGGVAADVLEACEVSLGRVRDQLEAGATDEPDSTERGPRLSLLAGRALARAGGQAAAGEEVGTEHLLLGIIGVREGRATRLLADSGVYLERLREVTLKTINSGAPPADAAQLARTDPGFTLEQHITWGYGQATREAHHIAQVRGSTHANLGDLVAGTLVVEEGWATGKSPTDSLLEGAWWVARPLLSEISEQHGRALDGGDLLVTLASIPEGIAASALASLGIDPDRLAEAVEKARTDGSRSRLLWPAELVSQRYDTQTALDRGSELEQLAQPRDELRARTDEAVEHIQHETVTLLDLLRQRLRITIR